MRNVQIIGFELVTDNKYYKRTVYTIMDFLGDVGGLFDALKGFGFILVTIYFRFRGDPVSKFLV